jgi:hypothetical protein
MQAVGEIKASHWLFHNSAARQWATTNTASGFPIPLIYEDTRNTLLSVPKKSCTQKSILCSFVGNITADSVLPNTIHCLPREC